MPFALLLATMLALTGCQSTGKTSSLEDRQKSAQLHYQIGIDALNKGQLPKAFDELLKSEKLDHSQPNTLDALGYAWRVQGDLHKAEEYYKRAIKLSPKAATYNNYGSLLVQMKKFQEAEVQLNQALNDPRYPNQDLAFLNLGDALIGQEKLDEAVIAYQNAKRFNNYLILADVRIAQAYIQMGRDNYGWAILEKLLELYPADRSLVNTYITMADNKHDRSSAIRALKAFLRANSNPLDQAWATDELEQRVKP